MDTRGLARAPYGAMACPPFDLRGIDVTVSQLALAAVAALRGGAAVDGTRTRAAICEAYGHSELGQVLKEWAKRRDCP